MRLGIVGLPQSGKTTLLRLMLGELTPITGDVRLGTNLEIAYFDQMRNRLREDKSLVENIGDGQEYIELQGKKKHVLSYLQDFLFSADRARGPISALSGGEKNRLLLASLFSRPSNVLVLDEPTNDLDMETLDLLADLLGEYKGTVLVVSHDRAFLDSIATTIIGIEENGMIYECVGGYSDYEKSKKRRETEITENVSLKQSKEISENRISTTKKKRSYKEEMEYNALPDKIEQLEAEIEKLQIELTDASVYTNPEKLIKIQTELAEKESLLLKFYERYEELDSIGS